LALPTHTPTPASHSFHHRPRPHRHLHSFPTRRSSDLRSSRNLRVVGRAGRAHVRLGRYPFFQKATAAWRNWSHLPEDHCTFGWRSEEHTSELQSRFDLVCRLLLEKKKDQSESRIVLLL